MADSYCLENFSHSFPVKQTLQAAATACNSFSKDVPKMQLDHHALYNDQTVENCEDQSKILCPSSLQMSTEPTDLALQDGIVPLLGNPYFTSIMSEGRIRDFIVKIPSSFHQFLPSSSALAVLYCRGNEWVVKCCVYDHKKQLENGWEKFVVDNNLRIGDGCVFELMNFKESYPLKFKVQILDGQIPQDYSSRSCRLAIGRLLSDQLEVIFRSYFCCVSGQLEKSLGYTFVVFSMTLSS